ncbi:hypothetical protein J3R30DRAFT_3401768 [Lentinula aciculospora]|uniref:Uncharacterized protein n=1 Tax=Lentinula aciculospora TaxID=153920 RepID=A0A9W9DVF8_9AGAR|nr:hypothetical protein J3R30DRAFT_3401768 [Lentinula aciculospora]
MRLSPAVALVVILHIGQFSVVCAIPVLSSINALQSRAKEDPARSQYVQSRTLKPPVEAPRPNSPLLGHSDSSGDSYSSDSDDSKQSTASRNGKPQHSRTQHREFPLSITWRLSSSSGRDQSDPTVHWNVREVAISFLAQEGAYNVEPSEVDWKNGYQPEGTGLIQFEVKATSGRCTSRSPCRVLLDKPLSQWIRGQAIFGEIGLNGESWFRLHENHDSRRGYSLASYQPEE